MSGRNRIPRPVAWLLAAVLGVVATMAVAAAVENGSIGERSWQHPAVGSTVNGYAGAPVGSPIYRPQAG